MAVCLSRSLPNQVINRTRPTRRADWPAHWPYKRKGQRAQVALAFDNVVGAGLALDRAECDGEIQSAEFGLDP